MQKQIIADSIPLLAPPGGNVGEKGAALDDAGKAQLKSEVARHYEALEQLLAGDAFALGSRATLADIALYACLSRVELYSPRGIPAEYPNIRAWYARMKV